MNIKEEIINLYGKGVILSEKDNQLQYKSVGRKLNEDDLNFLKDHKQEILDVFNQTVKNKMKLEYGSNVCSPYPLTDIQMAYLLGRGEHFKYGGVSSHVYFEVKFPKLEKEKVQKVWDTIIARHDNLRLVIDENNEQRILESVESLEIIWNDNEDKASNLLTNIRNYLGNKYYDVNKWPMFDIGISQLSEESILHLSFDFLMLDWTSIWILLKEFEDMYFRDARPLEKFSYSFRQYVLEREQEKKCSNYIVDELYWKNNILSYPEPPILPINPENIENEFQRLSFCLEKDIFEKIKNISSSYGITLTNVLLTAFSVCIEPWCEKPNFTLNLTTMNRYGSNKDVSNIVGDFTSINPLNVSINRKGDFLGNAISMQKTLSENMNHRLFSGVEVLRQLRKINGGSSYILPIVFTSSIGTVSSQYKHLKLGEYGVSQTPQVFLDCQAMELNDCLQINWDIRKGIFSEYMIKNMISRYKDYLEKLSVYTDWSKIYNFDTLVDKEKIERKEINQTEEEFKLRTLHENIFQNINRFPESIAIIKGAKKTSYKELGREIAGATRKLKLLGINEGEKVGIMMDHSDMEVSTILAILNLGAAYVPIGKDYPESRINNIVMQANMRFILTDDINYQHKLEAEIVPIEIVLQDEYVQYNAVDINKTAYVIFTSGTTGMPKGVEITHKAAYNTIYSIKQKFLIQDESLLLAVSKLTFDLSVFDIFGVLSNKGTIVYPDDENRLNPKHWAELIEKHNINIWNSAPALMQLLITYLDQNNYKYNIKLTLVLLSGDWVSVSIPDDIKKYSARCKVIVLGGATEASIWSIYHICENEDSNLKSIPYGTPLPNQKFFILDSDMRDRPVFTQGEIYIGGLGLANGYISDKEKTDKSFIINPFTKERIYKTGDYGRYLPGGEIEFLGRKDNQVKVNGFRIELEEIEAGLDKNPKISKACVIYNKEAKDKYLMGYVTARKLKEANKDLFKYVAKEMNKYSVCYQERISLSKQEIEEIINTRSSIAENILLESLKKLGYFNDNKFYDVKDIMSNSKILKKYKWIIRYWLYYLRRNGYLKSDDGIKYSLNKKDQKYKKCEYNWESLKEKWAGNIGTTEFLDYIENSQMNLLQCLDGSIDPVMLLYPEGSDKVIKSIYEENIFAQYFNECISESIEKICKNNKKKKIRILEIGAGSGITSKRVLQCLNKNNINYEYFFTDVASSLVATAKSKLSSYLGVQYKVFDINKDYLEQGFVENQFDIIIAVGVIENAKNISKTMDSIKSLLGINSWFIFTEPIIEEAWILASQIFMMQEPKDDIRKFESYMQLKEWERILQNLEDNPTLIVPKNIDKLSSSNMRLFIKQFNTKYEDIEENEIFEFLRKYVPSYMIPRHFKVLTNMPLTANGKVDRNKLKLYSSLIKSVDTKEKVKRICNEYDGGILDNLCNTGKDILGVNQIDPTESLYNYGADSLLMAQISGKVKEYLSKDKKVDHITFDMLLSNLINYPTMKDLEIFIKDNINKQEIEKEVVAKTRISQVGKVKYFGGKGETLRIVFHAGFGSLNIMKNIINEMIKQEDGAVIGIEIDNNDIYTSIPQDELVSAISREYSKLIVSEYNPSQVQLIGYCMGGLIATETASNLINLGINVLDVSLIDSHPGTVIIDDSLISEAIFLSNYSTSFGNIYPQIDDNELISLIKKVIANNGNYIKTNQLLEIVSKTGDVSEELKILINRLSKMTLEERIEEYVSLMFGEKEQSHFNRVLSAYKIYISSWKGAGMTPLPYFGKVRFFSAIENMEFLFINSKDTLNFWKEVCVGEFDEISIKGNHVTCIKDKENAKSLARKIRVEV